MNNKNIKSGVKSMKCKQKTLRVGKLSKLKVAMMVSALGLSFGSSAITGGSGDFSWSIDTTLSYGASWRMAERDSRLVGKANLNPFVGVNLATGQPSTLADRIAAPGRWSINNDNGNLNYGKGDLISNAAKFTTDIGFSFRDWGGFFRVTGFYDFENNNRAGLSEVAQEFVGKRLRLLDAYVYKDFEIAERYGSVRLGRQVVSWGESTFIQQGINVINPVDVSQLRVAGAELKEVFLPIDMITLSFDLTDSLSMEALYMFEFEQIDPDPAGTYFSTNDFATPGAEYVALGFGIIPELGNAGALSASFGPAADALITQIQNFTIGRANAAGASDTGQYGLAFRYFSQALNDTDFVLFYLNYHSRLPLISGVALGNPDIGLRPSSPSSGAYFIEYPENIDLFGLSFNTTINSVGWSIQGELSYRPNVPLQIDDVEVLFAALSPLNSLIPAEYNRFVSQLGEFTIGEYVQGWELHEVSQLQFTATKLFGPSDFLGTDQVVFLAEVGFTNVWDLPDQSVLRYQGPGTDTGGGPSVLEGGNGRNPITEGSEFFPSPFSWGYRLITRLDYNSVFGSAVNLSPRLAFNHDVNGTTPGPGGNFIEGRTSVTIGLGGTYLEKWSADISYTVFAGAGIKNLIGDRDFASVNIKYSF
ncbi:MAG: DUF1302 domain-containing protein [Proteobacteria bacterium]|nr:DUF1302 domain-containing protein [Pseudomonadota bacterium]